MVLISLLGWRALTVREQEYAGNLTEAVTRSLVIELEHHVVTAVDELRRAALRWERRGGVPRAEWEAEAADSVAGHPELQALEWADASGTVRWVVPLAGNGPAVDLDLRAETVRRKALEEACASRLPRIASPLELRQGGAGFVALAPIFLRGRCDGFIVGVFRLRQFFDHVLSDHALAGCGVAVVSDGKELYRRGPAGDQAERWLVRQTPFRSYGLNWTLQVQSDRRELRRPSANLPEMALAGGLLLALLTTASLGLARRARRRAEQIEVVTADLRRQVLARERAEGDLLARARLAELTAEVGLVLTRGNELGPMLQPCAEALVRHLDAAFARIWTLDDAGDVLELRASAGIYTHLDGAHARVSPDSSMFSVIARQRQPYLTNLLQDEPRVDRDWARREGLVAFAGHPLLVNRKLVGATVLFSRHPLSEHALKALGAVADAVAVGIQRGLSEEALQRKDELLRQSQKLEAVGRLAGGVAHDFNNILTVILTTTEFLLEAAEAGSTAQADLQLIKESGERAATLTGQLLAFSRKQVLQPRVLDPSAVVRGLEKMLHRLLGEDVDLQVALAPDCPTVLADPGQMEQVVLNLAVNARDAMPRGGRLTVETSRTELGAADAAVHQGLAPGTHAVLRVTDEGEGMDAAVLSRIFEPFFTTKAKGRGTGLGLATVYGIVRQSGGDIAVRSQPGQGTSFAVYLPSVERTAVEVAAGPVRPPRPAGPVHLLLVEDEACVRAMTHRILSHAGYNVLDADGPEEAGRLLARHEGPLHMLVSDIVMPGGSGPALAEKVRERYPDLKVLFMSGYTDDTIIQHGVSSDAATFLAKPFTAAQLLRMIHDALGG